MGNSWRQLLWYWGIDQWGVTNPDNGRSITSVRRATRSRSRTADGVLWTDGDITGEGAAYIIPPDEDRDYYRPGRTGTPEIGQFPWWIDSEPCRPVVGFAWWDMPVDGRWRPPT